MPKDIHKVSATQPIAYNGHRRFEHWYVDNQIYFITARCTDRYPAFVSQAGQKIFWDRWLHYAKSTPIHSVDHIAGRQSLPRIGLLQRG